jgi:hypothetical protein
MVPLMPLMPPPWGLTRGLQANQGDADAQQVDVGVAHLGSERAGEG